MPTRQPAIRHFIPGDKWRQHSVWFYCAAFSAFSERGKVTRWKQSKTEAHRVIFNYLKGILHGQKPCWVARCRVTRIQLRMLNVLIYYYICINTVLSYEIYKYVCVITMRSVFVPASLVLSFWWIIEQFSWHRLKLPSWWHWYLWEDWGFIHLFKFNS
jgi:hypothetical protein